MEPFKKNPMYTYLLVLVICASAGFQGWMALFTNFAKEVVGVNGFQIGVGEFWGRPSDYKLLFRYCVDIDEECHGKHE